jgi:hypothetical protein
MESFLEFLSNCWQTLIELFDGKSLLSDGDEAKCHETDNVTTA